MKPNDPLELLRTWIAAVNAWDAEKVLSLYHEDAVLLPTFSSEIRQGLARIQDYFTGVYKNDRVTVELIEDTITVQDLGNGVAVLGGLYNWVLASDGQVRQPVARYTYCVDMKLPRPILHHHSSVVPGG